MSQKKISVIIPIYNAEKYLEKCLESLNNQSYRNYEVILVNDGSTDNSKDICIKFQSEAKCEVLLINQCNKGEGGARNVGIRKSSGEYICFVDADDWVEDDYIESLASALSDEEIVDISIVGCVYHYKRKIAESIGEGQVLLDTKEQKWDSFFGIGKRLPSGANWSYLYSKKVIEEYKLFFDESLKLGADSSFNFRMLMCCGKVNINYDAKPYHYFFRANSMAHTNVIERYYLLIEELLQREELLKQNQMKNYTKYIKSDICAVAMTIIGIKGRCDESQNALEYLRKYEKEYCMINGNLNQNIKLFLALNLPSIYHVIYKIMDLYKNEMRYI